MPSSSKVQSGAIFAPVIFPRFKEFSMKLFLTCVLLVLSLVSGQQALAQSCESTSDAPWQDHYADYLVTISQGTAAKSESQLRVYRSKNKVAYYYPATQISQVWYQNPHGRTVTTRYFHEFQRAIEYGPMDPVGEQSHQMWSQIFQLVSNKTLQQMEKVKSEENSCHLIETYQSKTANNTLTVKWDATVKMASLIVFESPTQSRKWERQSLNYEDISTQEFFRTLEQYQTTDYADIGDDHTDPFLLKMVNLGFIEKGASGFYQADGTPMESEHHHH